MVVTVGQSASLKKSVHITSRTVFPNRTLSKFLLLTTAGREQKCEMSGRELGGSNNVCGTLGTGLENTWYGSDSETETMTQDCEHLYCGSVSRIPHNPLLQVQPVELTLSY